MLELNKEAWELIKKMIYNLLRFLLLTQVA